jgi:phospholipid/cholesterol/gamma-HCH transport system ATP-binding protein
VALFEIRGLKKAFGRKVVFDGLDLDIAQGEFVTIVGESGSGKSVLLKCMIGLIPVDAGTIVFDGQDITALSEKELTEVRQRIGMLFQAYALFDSMNIRENVAYGLREQFDLPEDQIDKRVAEALSLVGLDGTQELWPSDLSGGMKKRVALARAISFRPEVVFYDEPTEGLDPINVTRVNRLMLGLQDALKVTTVVVTHNMKSAFATSDRILMIHDGVIAVDDTPDALRASTDPLFTSFVGKALLG